uniref:uncharacterized protein LOC118543012 isoform X3 n=1 Tax=Halichoerus grypus TaxID=9711 RepID=UPI00165A0148|nr:uncharacterized protein LOC118543012 isoform X3 [Halichoerus grypus]
MATHPTCTPAEERGGRGKNSPYCLYSFCQKSIIRRTLQPQARELVSVEAPPRLVSCILPRLLQLGHWPGDGQRPCCPEDGRNETSLPCCNVSFLFIFLVPSLRELKGVEMECSDCPDIMLCPPSTRMAAWGLSPGVGRCKLGEGRAPKGAPASGEQEGGLLLYMQGRSMQIYKSKETASILKQNLYLIILPSYGPQWTPQVDGLRQVTATAVSSNTRPICQASSQVCPST